MLHVMEDEWIELCAKFEVLKRDYKRQHDAFYLAFLYANDLLLPYNPNAKTSAADIEKSRVAFDMSMGITKSNLHKQLEAKELA